MIVFQFQKKWYKIRSFPGAKQNLSGKWQREPPPFVWSSPFALLLIQQQKFHFPSPLYRADFPTLVVAVGYVFHINVPVARFQLFHQTAFRTFTVAEQSPVPHIVAKNGQEQGIFFIFAEQLITLCQVQSENQNVNFRKIKMWISDIFRKIKMWRKTFKSYLNVFQIEIK